MNKVYVLSVINWGEDSDNRYNNIVSIYTTLEYAKEELNKCKRDRDNSGTSGYSGPYLISDKFYVIEVEMDKDFDRKNGRVIISSV